MEDSFRICIVFFVLYESVSVIFVICFLMYRLYVIFSYYSHWSNKQAEAKILKGPHGNLENYLKAIDQLKNNIQFFGSNKGFKNGDSVVSNANNLIAKAISKLEDEFKQLLSSYRFVVCSLTLLVLCPSFGLRNV